MLMNIFYALKQALVQTDIVGMLGKDGTHLLSQRIHLVVGLGRKQIKEYSRNATQQIVVALLILLVIYTDNGIVECRFCRIIDNTLYLFIVATDAFQHSLFEIFHADTVEWGCVVRCVIRFKERVRSSFLFVYHYTNSFRIARTVQPVLAFSMQSYDKNPILYKTIH